MKITDILSPEMVLPNLQAKTKPDVLRELSTYLASRHREINAEMLTAVLAERERLGSTAIGDGIAIPHGKLAGVAQITGLFGRHLEGIDFDSLDGKPTRLFFLLVAPEDSANLHLKALARVSRLMKDEPFRQRLINAPDANEIFRLIKEEDSRH